MRTRSVVATLVAATLPAACVDDGGGTGTGASTAVPTTTTTGPAGTDPVVSATDPVVSTAEAPAGAEPALTFGYLAPGVGLLNSLAIGQERGLTLAIEEINVNGGVLGAPVAMVTSEESADQSADSVLDDLLAQDADVIVGPVGSATAASLVPTLAERSLLACSASATASSLTEGVETDAAPVFVRTALRDDQFARVVADELTTSEDGPVPVTVMIVGRDDTYGNELTAALSAELTARGVNVSTLAYPPRRVDFREEAAAVVTANPDVVVAAAYTEAPRLVARIVESGYDVDRIVGLDGLLVPRLAEQTFPSDPARADGLRVIGMTGDRALMSRLAEVPAVENQVSYGPQMYDCVMVLALAAVASGSTEPATIAGQLSAVTTGGRTCSTFAHCVELLEAGEDIDYDGTTGPIALDAAGDISSARIVDGAVTDGELRPVGTREVDLVEERQEEIFASAVFVAQLQQALKLLGFYDGDVTGIYDETTAAAVSALQRALGVPETGEYDAATDAALRQRLGGGVDALRASVSEMQKALTELGYYSGPIDGHYSDATVAAVKAFQLDLGVPETGIIDVPTLRAIYARGAAGQPDPPATTTTGAPPTQPPEPPPVTTAPPTEAPPATAAPPVATEPPVTVEPAPGEPTLYDVLADDPDFSTLVEVIRAAGYGTDLTQPEALTLFAPVNAAFDSLEDGELDELRTDAAAADALLRDLAIEGALPADELTTGDLTTIGGSSVEVVVDGATITLGGATVVQPDLTASNGIAHGIDALPVPG